MKMRQSPVITKAVGVLSSKLFVYSNTFRLCGCVTRGFSVSSPDWLIVSQSSVLWYSKQATLALLFDLKVEIVT